MAKTFNETFSILPASHEHIRPSDVSSMTAAAAADVLTGKASSAARGQALVRALVESAYGTPHVKALITANKKSPAARMLAQCWPILPSCNNSSKEEKRRLLSAVELSDAIAHMARTYDKLVTDKEASKAEKTAPVDTATPEATPATVAEQALPTILADREKQLIDLLKEALAVRALPKSLKEKITAAIA